MHKSYIEFESAIGNSQNYGKRTLTEDNNISILIKD